jgi:drug/metabolite transporter (DMT)-like permease
MPATDLTARTRIFTVLTVLSNVAGNSALTRGMQQIGDPGNTPLALIGALFHPWVAVGVALLIVWTITHMMLLSWADLSYVMPVTAIGYVATAFAARFFLGESVSLMRWAGIVLITLGVTLVSRTVVNSRAASRQ